ncbi:MAG: hypothetical protein Q8K98_03165 [Bacteroidota bacterium]|nr:hypothetical protein [Bacteroidota bacterium]
MEWWNYGVVELWIDGLMEWWNGGMREYWGNGIVKLLVSFSEAKIPNTNIEIRNNKNFNLKN